MADEIGTVRVEMVADPSGITRGIEAASSSLTKIAAVGTFVGNLLTTAFLEVGRQFLDTVSEITSGQGDIWDELSKGARNAATLLHNSFNQMKEGATEFQATIAERVLPGLAALAEAFVDLSEDSIVAKVGIELIVGAFKLVATACVVVITTLQLLGESLQTVGNLALVFGSAITEAMQAILAFKPQEALAALGRIPGELMGQLRQGGTDLAKILNDSARLISDVWREAEISTRRAGAAIVVENEALERHMRKLGQEAKRVFEQTRTPAERLQIELDKLNVLLAHGLISWDTYGRAVQAAQDKMSGAQQMMQQIGNSFEAAFVDAVTGAKSLQDALKQLLKDLARIAAQAVFRSLFGQLFGFIGKGVTSGFGAAPTGGGGMFANARGGLYEVAGSGGIDSQVVAFRATPGERVSVGHAAKGGAGAMPRVTVNNYSNAQVTAERGRDNGELVVAVRSIVRDEFSSGRMNPTMAQTFGVRPRSRSR